MNANLFALLLMLIAGYTTDRLWNRMAIDLDFYVETHFPFIIRLHGAIQAKAEVEAKCNKGNTPLNHAAANGHIACVDRLLQVCVTCSCFALPLVPSADQDTLFCLFVSFAS